MQLSPTDTTATADPSSADVGRDTLSTSGRDPLVAIDPTSVLIGSTSVRVDEHDASTAIAIVAAIDTTSLSLAIPDPTASVGTIADVLAHETIALIWDADATANLIWDADATTVPLTMADNELPQKTVPASGENIDRTFPIEDTDGSAKSLAGASVEWYLLPSRGNADADAIIDHTTTDVTVEVSDEDGGIVSLSVDQGVTDDVTGRYWQRLVVDDGGPGKQVWGGRFTIEEI